MVLYTVIQQIYIVNFGHCSVTCFDVLLNIVFVYVMQ
jgi:hypothetical protein